VPDELMQAIGPDMKIRKLEEEMSLLQARLVFSLLIFINSSMDFLQDRTLVRKILVSIM
jgi:hypothetical protein